MFRLFVALAMPDPVRSALAALQYGVPGAKWVSPENLHLTLRFIGNVDGRTYSDVTDALAGVRAPAFDLTLQGVGYFGEKGRIDSLWVGIAKGDALLRLQNRIESAVQRIGLEPEHRRFLPHVTLGRLRSSIPDTRLGEWLAERHGLRLPPWRVDEFALYSSILGRKGAIYQAEASFGLTGAVP